MKEYMILYFVVVVIGKILLYLQYYKYRTGKTDRVNLKIYFFTLTVNIIIAILILLYCNNNKYLFIWSHILIVAYDYLHITIEYKNKKSKI